MPTSRPAGDPVSFPGPSDQYYVTRGGRRLYLGSDREIAMQKFHRLSAGLSQKRSRFATCPYPRKSWRTVSWRFNKRTGVIAPTRSVGTTTGAAPLGGCRAW